jgi:hypothetical protein
MEYEGLPYFIAGCILLCCLCLIVALAPEHVSDWERAKWELVHKIRNRERPEAPQDDIDKLIFAKMINE